MGSVVAIVLIAAIATGQSVPSGPSPTAAGATSIATAGPSPDTSGPPSASTSLGRSAAPWATQAAQLLSAERRLAATRERLAAAMSEVPPSANVIARELRTMNPTLTGALEAIASMGASGAPAALLDDLRTAHEATLAVSLETLQSSVQNVPAYQAGAAEIVALLDEVSLLARDVRLQAGLPSQTP